MKPMKESYQLNYSIHKCSSYIPPHVPENILEDKPNDQKSRWSCESNNPSQFIMLKLDHPSIVKEITFGKFQKAHMCTLKQFKVLGGIEEKNMIELLNSGLKDNNIQETFPLRHSIRHYMFPCRYITILPIQSWGPGYDFSIWYIKLSGIDDAETVNQALITFYEYREREAIRLCLKYFRQHNFMEAYEALTVKSGVALEDPLLTELHHLLVIKGDFAACEVLLENCLAKGYFNDFLKLQRFKVKWFQVVPCSNSPKPGMRSGHQMCFDPLDELIYLFGGWDGSKELADFWKFHVPSKTWTCLSIDVSDEGGPRARSCHRMCLDYKRKRLYIFGRYFDSDSFKANLQDPSLFKGDFFVYNIESNQWELISDDTAASGGPSLLQHHQMLIDIDKNVIYVFGGSIYEESSLSVFPSLSSLVREKEDSLSGLYSYNVTHNKWKLLRDDIASNNQSIGKIRSRTEHSMVFHSTSRLIYIFGGQRNKEHLKDMITYNVDTDEIKIVIDGEYQKVPIAELTHRVTIDDELDEIHILCGINREKEKCNELFRNSFWVYDIKNAKWSCIQGQSEKLNEISSPLNSKQESCPRCALQIVYDHVHKVHYLFGGTSSWITANKFCLDDLWSLELCRLESNELLRKCKKLIRELNFEEKVTDDPINAVHYLQSDLSQVFDHTNSQERKEFELLASLLFIEPNQELEYYSKFDRSHRHIKRSKLFDILVDFFPESMTHPKEDLINFIKF